MGNEACATGKQKHAELAEVSLGSLDATKLLLQMPAVLSTWLPGDSSADLQNEEQRERTCVLQLQRLADADPHCALSSRHWARSQPARASRLLNSRADGRGSFSFGLFGSLVWLRCVSWGIAGYSGYSVFVGWRDWHIGYGRGGGSGT